MKTIEVSKKAAAMGFTLALALAVGMAISGIPAMAQEPPKTLVKHVLQGTYYVNNSPGASASCGTQSCVAIANIYTENIPCPGATGVFCTYEVSIAAQTSLVPYQNGQASGLYQILIDGVGWGGGGPGYFVWGTFVPVQGTSSSSAFSATSQVVNTSTNQSHSIVVNIGCMGGPGCSVKSGVATLTVRVLKP
jgi:hypothetical protein